MKRIYKIVSGIAFVSLLTLSCTKDFESINTDPNNPKLEQALPNLLLTNAIESATDRVHEIFLGHETGSCWVQHLAKVQYTDEDRYIPRVAVINNTWNSFYAASGEDIVTLYDISVASGNKSYQGVALVLKSYVVSVLTDLFGDIPYTNAWKASEGILSPSYDTQQSVYEDIIAKLDTANTLLAAGIAAGDEIEGDILYGNDVALWQKFANSLRVRLLLRISGREATLATTELTKIVADPATYPIFESSDDNAALAYLGSSPNNNPVNENRKTRDDHRVSENFINLLKNTYGDYRLFVFAKPAAGTGTFVGLPNGLTSAKAAAFNGNGLSNTSKIGDYFTAATAPGQLESYAELQFALAEAALKGYIPGGKATARTYYVAGITGSFEQYNDALQAIFDTYGGGSYGSLGIPDGYTVADEIYYHTEYASAPSYFDVSADNATLLQLIAEEKYIATFDQGLQSWFEWRRLGYPILTPAVDGVISSVPVRLTYPADESARNLSNLNAAIANQGADELTTRVWWDIN